MQINTNWKHNLTGTSMWIFCDKCGMFYESNKSHFHNESLTTTKK